MAAAAPVYVPTAGSTPGGAVASTVKNYGNNNQPIVNSNDQVTGYGGAAGGGAANNAMPVINSNDQVTGYSTPTGTYGTLNANISNPTTTTQPAPVVLTSNAAQTDLTNKQTQSGQMQSDAQNQAATVAANNAAQIAAQTPQGTPNQQSQTQGNQTSSPEDQLTSLLNNLGNDNTQTDTDTATQLSPIQAQITATQSTLDQGFADTSAKLNAIASGTYPLSPSEQALLSSTTAIYQQTIQAQSTANTAFTGQMIEAMASLGINTSAPTQAIGNIQSSIDSGNSKISMMNAQMAQSLGQLQQGFQQQDYQMVQDSWTDTSNYLNTRMTTLTDMQNTVLTQAQQQKTDNENFTKDAMSAIMDSNTIDNQTKQLALQNAQLSETTRHDIQQEAIDRANAAKGVYTMTSTGQIMNTVTGQVAGSQQANAAQDPSIIGHTGNPIVDANTKRSADGIPFVDGTNLTGTLADNAQLTAAQNNIPYLGKDAASGMAQAISVGDSLKTLQTQLSKVNASSYADRPLVQAMNAVGGATQANTTVAAINSYKATAIPLLKALSNGASGFRITQTELNQASNMYLPNANDTVAVAQAKIDNINQILSNGEKGIFGDQVYSEYKPDSDTAPITNTLNSISSAPPTSSLMGALGFTSNADPTHNAAVNLASQYDI